MGSSTVWRVTLMESCLELLQKDADISKSVIEIVYLAYCKFGNFARILFSRMALKDIFAT